MTPENLAELKSLREDVAKLQTTVEEAGLVLNEVNTFYVMWAATLVFLMQLGFAMLSAGAVRTKNTANILLKGVLDACLGSLVWYFVGYGFAYDIDGSPNPFIGGGKSHFALSGMHVEEAKDGRDWVMWFFQYAFAAAAATIVSGAVAERCQLSAYLIYTVAITGFVYPVVVHWVWDTAGFLCAWNPDDSVRIATGMVDFAGSGVVHMTGGWAALCGAAILGPRLGRFDINGNPAPGYSGHSMPLTVLGTFILWGGWYGFNQGSTLGLQNQGQTAARVGVTTTLAAGAAAVTGLYLKYVLPRNLGGTGMTVWDLGHTCNSLLGGLVGITAGCAVVEPYAAIIIGIIAAFVYHGASCLMRRLKIDDPLDAFAVHGACGVLGVIVPGLFGTADYTENNGDGDGKLPSDPGIFYGGSGMLLGAQICGCVLIQLWVVTLSVIMFFILKKAKILRVPIDVEEAGLDMSKHGGSAYPDQVAPPSPGAKLELKQVDVEKA